MKNRIELPGERITVRRYTISDLPHLVENINDESVARWTANIPHPYSEKDAASFIRKSHSDINRKKGFPLVIALNETGKVIGGTGLHGLKEEERFQNAEMGYWLGKKYRNQGIVTEAAGLMLDFAFNKLKLHKVNGRAFEKNIASQRIFEKSGFVLEGMLREIEFRNSEWQNMLLYGLLKEEYLSQRP